MTTPSEQDLIDKCTRQMERKLNRGPASAWTQYDFEKLSDSIFAETQVVLSVTTLKRVWGKLKYPNAPSTTTLNTLAAYLGFEDWHSFKRSYDTPQPVPVIQTPAAKNAGSRSAWLWYLAFVLVLLAAFYFLLGGRSGETTVYKPADFSFSANKVISEGVPNSVVFNYDASRSRTDSVYIIQTWDISRKTLVSKHKNAHSAIYYYPGFFRTKLIVGNQVVKSHDLQISSGGWLALAENAKEPVYFKKQEYLKDSMVEIDENTLQKYRFSLIPDAPRIRFFHQGDMGDLLNDNFVFETTLKNTYDGGNNACRYVEVLIQCKADIIIIPLCAKACIGKASLFAAGMELRSKEADLSGFGADLGNWTTLRVETVNKRMQFFVNGRKAASFVFPNDPTGIVGLQYRFNGTGAVRNTWFENKTRRINLD